jgi:hypothetical protein
MNHEAYKKGEYEPRLQIPLAPLQLNLSGVLFTPYFRLYKIYVTEQKPSKLKSAAYCWEYTFSVDIDTDLA